MKNMIEQELNKLAKEILEQREAMKNMFSSLPQTPTKGKKLDVGFNYITYSSLNYAFVRFFPFANKELLSKDCLDLFSEIQAELSDLQSLANLKQDLPEELKNFLENG